mmetsp:Transcript_81182/g.160973  ORF Transcript_81182/g.160973 Transcript_81182/m.160973 type:complete len:163 (-) Transcript_81182:161-649(-)
MLSSSMSSFAGLAAQGPLLQEPLMKSYFWWLAASMDSLCIHSHRFSPLDAGPCLCVLPMRKSSEGERDLITNSFNSPRDREYETTSTDNTAASRQTRGEGSESNGTPPVACCNGVGAWLLILGWLSGAPAATTMHAAWCLDGVSQNLASQLACCSGMFGLRL